MNLFSAKAWVRANGLASDKPCVKTGQRQAFCWRIVFLGALALGLWVPATFHARAFAQTVPNFAVPASHLQTEQIANPACTMPDKLILAEYQVWHGLPSHTEPQPYNSTDPTVIARHIQAAQARCINGFVIDWYGPPSGLPTDADRQFEDVATAEVLRQADSKGFQVALMYDEGTLKNLASTTDYTAQVIHDLRYASQYFTQPSYLKLNGQPVVFVFPYEALDAHLDWATIRQQLGVPIMLLDKDPNPDTPQHDALFDGFYTWVQASTPQWPPDDWGEGYLRWFYQTMKTPPYAGKVAIGGVWPGFTEPTMTRAIDRYMARRCGQTWLDTWALVETYAPSIVMISTWNDFSEATDIEEGILKMAVTNDSPTFAHQATFFNAAMSDCADTTYTWDFGDGTTGSGATASHVYTATGVYTAVVTATNVTATLFATTPVQIKSDVVAWQENFDPLTPTQWQQVSARWIDTPGPTAKLCEDNPADIAGKAESSVITANIANFSHLQIATTTIDPDARYTIQLLDKTTNVATDVLTDVRTSGIQDVDLAEQLQWTGVQRFTLNVWIIGEGKCAVFDRVSLEKNPAAAEAPASTQRRLFLPIINR